ncbi:MULTISPECIES: nuclear transport factor 2 family protein [unclassified Rhodococcus (in: high G+C Gram-positive bacteria)]|uniref:nuclear transport factor 2 family protein n=1 Tax=unclassified Rhodococcus (in: high G+C Gram-positive bacteria) TaxID=192944 RepID=UPI00096AB636|nr:MULTISPECIES: nuclear transport factor 2 family protein [unclassified Rhodococcus (in: high G+C Gram-positive bacteria)]
MSNCSVVATEDVAAIHQLYGRQSHCIDSGRQQDWAQTFTDGGEFHSPSYPEPVVGFDALAAFAARFFAAAEATDEVHRHVLTNLVVEAVDESALTVHGYLQIVATARGGDSRLVRMTTVTDHVVRVGEEWKIARRTVSRDDAPRASEQA